MHVGLGGGAVVPSGKICTSQLVSSTCGKMDFYYLLCITWVVQYKIIFMLSCAIGVISYVELCNRNRWLGKLMFCTIGLGVKRC